MTMYEVRLRDNWLRCTPAQAAEWADRGEQVREVPVPADWPACEFCGARVARGNVDRFGRVWCGCDGINRKAGQ